MARIQQVKGMRGFQDHFISGQWQIEFDQLLAFLLVGVETFKQEFNIGVFESYKPTFPLHFDETHRRK